MMGLLMVLLFLSRLVVIDKPDRDTCDAPARKIHPRAGADFLEIAEQGALF